MTIRKKIWVVPLLMLVIFGITLVLNHHFSTDIQKNIASIQEIEHPYLRQIERLDRILTSIQSNLDAAVTTGEVEFLAIVKTKSDSFRDIVNEIQLTKDKAAFANELSLLFNDFIEKALFLADALLLNDATPNVTKMSQQVVDALLAIQQPLKQEINESNLFFDQSFLRIIENTNQARRFNMLLAIALILGASITSLVIIRSIFKRFDILQQGAKKIAAGNYSGNFPTEGDDELTEVMASFNVMESALEKAVSEQLKANDTLEKLNAELETSVINRTEKLTSALRELKQMQNKLLHSEKMAALGQLSAGVAHEINNPISFISSNMSSLSQYIGEILELLDTYEAAESQIQDIKLLKDILAVKGESDIDFIKKDIKDLILESEDGVQRVKKIVHDLKNFCFSGEEEWQFSDIHSGLDSTLNILRNEIKDRIEVIKQYGEIPQVECVPSQLNQVFLNLLVNAAQAIEDQGKITISTGLEGNQQVWIEVSDTGKGIPEEHRQKIFDPFFTSKQVGEGTGLGLSLSYGIVQKHTGRIEVKTSIGEGSTFTIWLPIRQSQAIGEQTTS